MFPTQFLLLSDDDFTNAEAFILTFSLNNYARNNPKFKVAMQWEKKFLQIVQDYQKSPESKFTFAYMAEVKCIIESCSSKNA